MKTQSTLSRSRILASFAVAGILAFAAGCGGGDKQLPDDSNGSKETNGTQDSNATGQWWQKKNNETPEKEKLYVAFVTNQIADFWNIAKAGCRDAEKDLDVEVEVKMPPEATVIKQKQIVEDLVSAGIQGLAISPLDADNQTQWLNGIAAKLPLITHDSDAPASNRRVYIGMDNYKAGRMCGELVREALPDGGAVMLFIGRLEQDNSKHRRQGVIDELFGRDRPETLDKLSYDPVEGVLDSGKYKILGTLTDRKSV
ncbi:MAG: substrate-binding domain-containing protein, partial [Opitutales bacterium]